MIAHSRNEEILDYSKKLLLWFVKNASHFYGSIFKVLNVHNLIHIHDDIIHHKLRLFDFAAFAFKNYIETLKCLIRKSKNSFFRLLIKNMRLTKQILSNKGKDLCTKLTIHDRDR